jgi:hypothetical protein
MGLSHLSPQKVSPKNTFARAHGGLKDSGTEGGAMKKGWTRKRKETKPRERKEGIRKSSNKDLSIPRTIIGIPQLHVLS